MGCIRADRRAREMRGMALDAVREMLEVMGVESGSGAGVSVLDDARSGFGAGSACSSSFF